MSSDYPKICICIPHWQVKDFITVCLRSIRKHSEKYNLEIIVVDNGSRDESLDYLRSLPWIRLIERPAEKHTNWPHNVFSAWDLGIQETDCDYYITMHSDVFVKSDNWLDPFLREVQKDPRVAASGSWKLVLENPLYTFQKRVLGYALAKLKSLFGSKRNVMWKQGHYPRDYCAMYRPGPILKHNLTFNTVNGWPTGGFSIAKQLWEEGYSTLTFPIREMDKMIAHVAHGTAAVRSEKPLNHRSSQMKVEKRVFLLFEEPWIKSLAADESLDGLTRKRAS